MKQIKKVAVIGTGIGAFHIEGYAKAGIEEIVVVDIDVERGMEVCRKYGIPHDRFYPNHKQMLDQAGVDAVSVAVPNDLHYLLAMDCLRAGKHVLCEKPPTRTVEQCMGLIAAAEQFGVKLMWNFNNCCRPDTMELGRLADEGSFGDIYDANCGWVRRFGIPAWGNWFTQIERSGGGPMIDLGVHMLAVTLRLMGWPKPVTVTGAMHSVFGPNKQALGPWGKTDLDHGWFDVEDLSRALILFEGGQTINLEASWAGYIEQERVFCELRGTEGGALLETLISPDGEERSRAVTFIGKSTNTELATEADQSMGRHGVVGHFVNVVEGDAEPIITPENGLAVMKILCGAYESAKIGKSVDLS